MPAESAADKRAAKVAEHDPLPCPRCDSNNTKFCYYNNYNFSQPRHFCKSCRRYWTQGGTLRDVPVGGSSRKTAKRLRTAPVISGGSQPVLGPMPAAPVFVSLSSAGHGPSNGGGTGSGFTSLLSGFGVGVGVGVEDAGFGLGRGFWAFPEVGFLSGAAVVGGASGAGACDGGNISKEDTWQVGIGGECGFGVAGDCFASLPELAISTQAHGLK